MSRESSLSTYRSELLRSCTLAMSMVFLELSTKRKKERKKERKKSIKILCEIFENFSPLFLFFSFLFFSHSAQHTKKENFDTHTLTHTHTRERERERQRIFFFNSIFVLRKTPLIGLEKKKKKTIYK